MSTFSCLFLFSFRFNIYMPYRSSGILSFMDVIKQQFKWNSAVLVSGRKKKNNKKRSFTFAWTLIKSWLFYLYFFCKANCIENVTKDVPRNKLYPPCIVLKLTSDGRPVHVLLPFPSALHHRTPCCCLEVRTGIHSGRVGHVPERRIAGVTVPLPVQTRLGGQWPLWDRSLDY